MRARMVTAFTALAALCMICFAVGIGNELAMSRTRGLVIDRVQDANRFAVLAATDPENLREHVQDYLDSTGNGVFVLGADGTVMAAIGVNPADEQVIEATRARYRLEMPLPLYPWNTAPILLAQPIATPPQAGGVVVVAVSTSVTRNEIAVRWTQLACVTATALLVFSGLALLVSGWILRPVSGLLREVDALTSTLPVPRVPPRRPPMSEGPPEILQLAAGVESVTRAVAALAAAERQHVVDTAHSLRNPLAALAVRLQALQPMIAADVAAATFVSVVSEVDRLTALLDGLLSSAAVDTEEGEQADPPVAECDAVRVAAGRVEAWRDAYIRADITLTLEPLVTAAQTRVPGSVLDQMLDVALSNSARYAGAGASTTVTVDREAESVVVSVADTGVGVPPDEIDLLTTRFFRGAQAVEGGSGLGLPIAATLAAQHYGLLFVESAQPHGLVVTVSLPAVTDPADLTSG